MLDRIKQLKQIDKEISKSIARLNKIKPIDHYQNETKTILKEILKKQKVMSNILSLLVDYSFSNKK